MGGARGTRGEAPGSPDSGSIDSGSGLSAHGSHPRIEGRGAAAPDPGISGAARGAGTLRPKFYDSPTESDHYAGIARSTAPFDLRAAGPISTPEFVALLESDRRAMSRARGLSTLILDLSGPIAAGPIPDSLLGGTPL